MSKKFTLIKSDKVAWNGEALFQLKASISFGSVKKGELGGYVTKEENLSEDGNAWVSGDAQVSGDAWVYGNALVCGNARVSGNAWVSGDARVSGNARVETGYYLTTYLKNADITKLDMPDGYVTIVQDYKEPKTDSESLDKTLGDVIELNGKEI
jgi:carbonic anhydrase/acetyltransferase-like protein (isoleucine patch superfamily)